MRKACPGCRMAEARQPRLQAPAGAPLRLGAHQPVGPLRASRPSVLPVLAARRVSLVLAQQLEGWLWRGRPQKGCWGWLAGQMGQDLG